MTSEVAIANAGAVALAADSAVTIGNQKIYNSALKLFALSKIAPIGVMIYGNAELLNVPWETLIKSFRKELAGTKYDELKTYGDEFIKYLNHKPNIFPEESQRIWLKGNIAGYYGLIRDQFFECIHPILKEKGQVDSKAASDALVAVIERHHSALAREQYAEGMDADFQKIVRDKYQDEFKAIRQQIFENVSISATLSAKLNDIGAFLHTRQIFSAGVSGLVIAGYGEEEIYPSIIAYDIEGVIEGRLKYRLNVEKSHAIKSGGECRIVAFAQDDMVTTFMNGINPYVIDFMDSYLRKLFNRLPELLDESTTTKDAKRKFHSKSSRLLEGFLKELSDHINEDHAQPVLRMITVLPKDELAAMAEALVNLTAFKRRMTAQMETVGGPIDVAVISKGDGLVWVKRKHYFPPELNQQFFSNYFRGIKNGN